MLDPIGGHPVGVRNRCPHTARRSVSAPCSGARGRDAGPLRADGRARAPLPLARVGVRPRDGTLPRRHDRCGSPSTPAEVSDGRVLVRPETVAGDRTASDELDDRLEVLRDRVALVHERDALAHERSRRVRSPHRAAARRAGRPPGRRVRARWRRAARESETISASRRAASGAIVMRSSIPSACIVETSSYETGWARSRASAASAWAVRRTRTASSRRAPSAARAPPASPVRCAWSSFTDRSQAAAITGASPIRR